MSRPRRHHDFLIGFATTFAAVLGVPSVILSLSGGHFSVQVTSALTVFALGVAFVTNRQRLVRVHLPIDHIMIDHIDHKAPKRLRCPTDRRLVEQVARLAREFYGRDTIEVEIYEQLRLRNELILVCLVDSGGSLLGYFDVIPVRPTFAEMFLDGRMGEKDLSHADVLSVEEMDGCAFLYISGLAACAPETPAGMENGAILMWGLLKYLEHFYSASRPLAFASAVTREGEHLLQRFGLSLASHSQQRTDNHSVYTLALEQDEISKRAACIPDYSQLCIMDWDEPHWLATERRHRLPRRGKMATTKLRLLKIPPQRMPKAAS